MNYARLVKNIAELSAKSEKNLNKNTLGFNHLPEKLQQQVVDSAAKGLGRNPFDTEIDKRLLDSIKARLNNPNFRNKLKSSKFDNYSLDEEATKFLKVNVDKISKDLEDYTTVPLDYKDKANRVDLSKFVDEDDGAEMSQNEAISHLLYSENEPSTYKGGLDEFTDDLINTTNPYEFANKYYPENINKAERATKAFNLYDKYPQQAETLLQTEDILNKLQPDNSDLLNALIARRKSHYIEDITDYNKPRKEADWLNKAIQNYREDVALRDPSTLFTKEYTKPNYVNFNKAIEDYPLSYKNTLRKMQHNADKAKYKEPIRKQVLTQMYKKYKNVNEQPKASGWEHIQNDVTNPGSLTVYSKNQPYIFNSSYGNKYYPLDYLQEAIKDKYTTRNISKKQASMDKYLYDTTKDEQRLVNEDLLPKDAIDTDSITGNSMDDIYKYANIDNYERTNKGFNYYDKDELDALYNKETFGDEGYEQWWSDAIDNLFFNEIIHTNKYTRPRVLEKYNIKKFK